MKSKDEDLPLPDLNVSKINKVGLLSLILILGVALYLTVKAILPSFSETKVGIISGQILSPNTSDVIAGNKVEIKAEAKSPDGIGKVEFWAKHAGSWEKIGTVENSPYTFVWDTSEIKKPYAVTLTIHITDKKGNSVSDPGGWREDIILSN